MKNSDIAVSVYQVSKKFRLFNSTKERVVEALHPFRKKYHHEFWALKDVSFDIPKGQTFGILGRNGSGKSTLLQVIASVMQPTLGGVTVNGRIAALLELGAGFNPEFTGRENVILNGSIMGIPRQEILRRVPAIEAFADIGDFFDQPVKTYSSGMYVRVAFAAAINVDPDILIVDEALAVGDTKFQNKCYRKFHEFREKGKTIILVTHDVETVVRLCDYAVLLEQGRLVEIGTPNDVANIYFKILFGSGGYSKLLDARQENPPKVDSAAVLNLNEKKSDLEIFLEEIPNFDNCVNRRNYNKNESRTGNKRAEILDYVCISGNDFESAEINTGETVKIYIKIVFRDSFQFPVYGLTIKTIDGIKIFGTNTWLDGIDVRPVAADEIVIFCYEIVINLAGGDFFITLAVSDRVANQYVLADHRTDLAQIHVHSPKEGFNGIVEMDTMCRIISQVPMEGRQVSI